MNIDELTIGQIKKIQKMTDGCSVAKNIHPDHGKITLGILDRGHIVVGRLDASGDIYLWTEASIVRRWGTKNGLGQLAMEGPLDETRLDQCPMVSVGKTEVLFTMSCTQENWK